MDEPQVIEHGESSSARWLRERRLRLALLIAFVESLLVLFSAHGWRYVIIAVILAVAAYWFVGRRRPGVVYEITWVAAVSQLMERKPGSAAMSVLMGVAFFAAQFHWLGLSYRSFWPLLVVAVGVGIVLAAISGEDRHGAR